MGKVLYIYDIENLPTLKEELLGFEFITLTSIVRNCDNINKISRLDIHNHAIDLTNFFYDTRYNRWHRGVIEVYVEEIYENFPNTVFILDSDEKENFFNVYPFLFSQDNIYYFITGKKDDEVFKETISIDSISNEILVYREVSAILEDTTSRNIYSFSQLVKDFNGISANFDFDKLQEDKQYFIDITSLVEYLKYRKDQIFVYEMIFYKLSNRNNIKYLVHYSLIDTVHDLFPFIFREQSDFKPQLKDNNISYDNTNKSETIIDYVENICNSLFIKLKGHELFKEEFKTNLLKFKLLNKIGRRKIMSIFICGKSGVGKTEFARLLTEIMYPNAPLIKINFGNYSTEGVLNSLIGSPLGYIGSEDGGELINKIKASESKVILIDEFDKADEKVFNFFYELLEDGQFTDRQGNVHDLNGYIIVFTSNLNMSNYSQKIPEPLASRFDMKYFFTPIENDEKLRFIQMYSEDLIHNMKNEFNIDFNKTDLHGKLQCLIECDNLREIKRSIEDIVVESIKDSIGELSC